MLIEIVVKGKIAEAIFHEITNQPPRKKSTTFSSSALNLHLNLQLSSFSRRRQSYKISLALKKQNYFQIPLGWVTSIYIVYN